MSAANENKSTCITAIVLKDHLAFLGEYIYINFSIYQISGYQFSCILIGSHNWNVLGYSLFCEQREKWRVISRKFQKKKLWPLMKRLFPNKKTKKATKFGLSGFIDT